MLVNIGHVEGGEVFLGLAVVVHFLDKLVYEIINDSFHQLIFFERCNDFEGWHYSLKADTSDDLINYISSDSLKAVEILELNDSLQSTDDIVIGDFSLADLLVDDGLNALIEQVLLTQSKDLKENLNQTNSIDLDDAAGMTVLMMSEC